MPKPVSVDFEVARSLRQSGLSYEVIAARLNCNASTLRSRAHREKWDAIIAESQKIAQQHPQSLREQGDEWVIRMIGVLRKKLEYLEGLDPKKLEIRDVKLMSEITKNIDDLARRSFGFDQLGQNQFNVGLRVNIGVVNPDEHQAPLISVPAVPPMIHPGEHSGAELQ